MKEKTKQKRGGSGLGDIIKMTWNVESVSIKIESRCKAQW